MQSEYTRECSLVGAGCGPSWNPRCHDRESSRVDARVDVQLRSREPAWTMEVGIADDVPAGHTPNAEQLDAFPLGYVAFERVGAARTEVAGSESVHQRLPVCGRLGNIGRGGVGWCRSKGRSRGKGW